MTKTHAPKKPRINRIKVKTAIKGGRIAANHNMTPARS